jgi:hypothetical protein
MRDFRSAPVPKTTVSVEAVTSLDYDEFAKFHQHAFAGSRGIMPARTIQTPEYYRWKYLTPWGSATLSTATIDGAMVANVAAIPYPVSDGVDERIGWQICDIATHPDFRGRGLFRQCLAVLVSSLPSNSMVFCLPNRESFSAFIRLGFVQAGALRVWASVAPLLHARRSNERGANQNLSGRIPTTTPTASIFHARVDDHYLGWRFERRPDHEYRRVATSSGEGIAIVRSLVVGGQKTSILMFFEGSDAVDEKAILHSTVSLESRRASRAILYLDSHWCGSFRPLFFPLASWMLPRAFPIVSLRLNGALLHLRTCDWDVL